MDSAPGLLSLLFPKSCLAPIAPVFGVSEVQGASSPTGAIPGKSAQLTYQDAYVHVPEEEISLE